MKRYLLDTNILSDGAKPRPSAELEAWVRQQADETLFVASLTVAEVWRGILQMPAGKKRRDLETWFAGPDGLRAFFSGRILSFDERAGLIWARLMADGKAAGRPRSGLDMIIAAIAEANHCVIVTDNEKHFDGFDILNPLRAG